MIVLDSSFLIGFHNERDAHHHAASALMDQFLAGYNVQLLRFK